MTTVSCSSVDDVVRFAIDKEEKSMEFYRKCAGKAKNPAIREFFEELAQEEQHHRDMLVALDPAAIGNIRLDRVEDLHISDYLMDAPFKEDITYQEALTLAMKKEEKAHAFYSGWKNKCLHEKTEKLFALLAQEEMKHKRKIETLYDDQILMWD